MAKSSRAKSIKRKNANKREKLTKATDLRLGRLAEKVNQIIATDNEGAF
jgi:ribosomal protein L13